MDSLTLEIGHVLCCCASPWMRGSVRTFTFHDETRALNALLGPSPMNQEYRIVSIRNTFNATLEVNSFDADQPAKQVALKPALAQLCNAHCLTLKRLEFFGFCKCNKFWTQSTSKTSKSTSIYINLKSKIIQIYSVNCSILSEPTSGKGTTRHARPGHPDIH
jgi:hypothetical protein